MENILNKYKERLINISGRNRSLVTKKLYKKRAADLYKLKKFNDDIDDLILNYIMNREKKQLEILPDYMTYINEKKRSIQRDIEKEKEIELHKLYSIENKLEKSNISKKKKDIEDKYDKKLIQEYEKIDEIGEEIADFSNSITQLTREINSVEKETGRYELYVGYPFVEGCFKDSTFVKAPLFLFPVRLKEDKGNWYLDNILDQEILLNKVFLLAASKYNKIPIDEIETEFNDFASRFTDIREAIDYLGEYGIQIGYSKTSNTIKFKDTKKEDVSKYKNGELYINSYIVLGQFPVANSIYDDYQELENIYNKSSYGNEKNILLDKLLLSEDIDNNDISPDNEYYRKRPLKEEDYYFITPLDYSQEKALKRVNETDQLVIYGPPGTGKSQTIANIISDALAKDKKVLMVSQKRAALDVIYNRLNELNKNSIIIHDSNKDKKNFYYKVSNSIDSIISSNNLSYTKNQILGKSKSIDLRIEKLESLALTLSEKRDFGLTLQQMYEMSKEINSIDDSRYKEYRLFRNSNLLKSYNYNEIKDSIEEIKTYNLMERYSKYKEYKTNKSMILNIKDGLDKLDIREYSAKLEEIKTKYNNEIYLKSSEDEDFNEVIRIYQELENIVSDEHIKVLAQNINKKKNSDLLKPLVKDEYIIESKYKDSQYFNEFINLYESIEDIINENIINDLSRELNSIENKDLLKPLDKYEYINQTKHKESEYFENFIKLYKEIEDIVNDAEINKLADEINEKLNRYLLEVLDKESNKDKYEIRNKKYLDDFLKLYTTLEDIVDEDSIERLYRELNKSYNSYLLEPVDFGKWYTLNYWKNKKANQQKQLNNKLEYEIKEENIKILLNSYKEEIDRYVRETKYKNRKKHESSKNEIYSKFVLYKNDIDRYVNETKKNNKKEYDDREDSINRTIKSYKTDVDRYVEDNKYKNKIKYEKGEIDLYNKLKLIKEEIEELYKDTYILAEIIDTSKQIEYRNMIINKENLLNYLNNTIDALEIYEECHTILLTIKSLNSIEYKILDYICDNLRSYEDQINLLDNLLEFAILININEIEKQEKLDILLYEDFNNIVREVNECLKIKQQIIPEYISNKIELNFIDAKFGYRSSISRELERQANKKRQLWPIRKYLNEFEELLMSLFPCWLLGPETVSEILPLKAGLFDIVIFDEASQMFIETAIPTVYRGKKVIIAGDDKQLKPSGTFKAKIENEEEFDDIEVAAALEEESLLDLAKVNYDSVYLNYHYRSKYDELINFSNYAFYNGRLEVSPNTEKTDLSKEKPIERIKVDGKWIDRKNKEEAKEVFELIKNILMTRKNNETIGVITFNTGQQDLIEDMLDYEASKDPGFRKLYQEERDRIENNEDISLFVKNIENVQGEERDIIIFSTGYAPNEKGKLSLNFGSLSQDGGENRLNVAISRAKQKIYVITSIEPEELVNVENTKNKGPKLFKKYLEYVRSISNGDKDEATTILNSLLDSDLSRTSIVTFDSPFEEKVYEALTKAGFDVDTQIGVSGYKIDLGIYDRQTSKYILGIECDGAAYHSSKYARERDIHRQRYLESRGWNIVRIWSRDWWQNPQKEINNIIQMIGNIKNNKPIIDVKKSSVNLVRDSNVLRNTSNIKTHTIEEKNEKINRVEEKNKIAEFLYTINQKNKITEFLYIINQKIEKDNTGKDI